MNVTSFWIDETSRVPASKPDSTESFLRREDGMISLITLIGVLFFLILIGLVGNTGRIVAEKIETQNGADSIAHSSSMVMARTMNSVTAANHLIGELNALVTLHYALNADGEDRPPDSRMRITRTILDFSFRFGDTLCNKSPPTAIPKGPTESIYDKIKEIPDDAGATICWSMLRLQQVLGWVYQGHAIGGILQKLQFVPFIGPACYAAGIAICTACMIIEFKAYQERILLDILKQLADGLNPVMEQVHETVIPQLYSYEESIQESVPKTALKLINELKSENGLDAVAVFPEAKAGSMVPPLKTEPGDFGGSSELNNEMYRSQLVRATYPWVSWWRQPALEFSEFALLLARSGLYYQYFTDRYTLQKSFELKSDHDVQLFVLLDTDLATQAKGRHELWRNDSDRADRLFCQMGFGQRVTLEPISRSIYRPENPDGTVCYSQAMIYNANPQRPETGNRNTQAQVGWDTLNWSVPVKEVPVIKNLPDVKPDESVTWRPPKGVTEPQIRLNWQVKLVPVTRLADSRSKLKGPIKRTIDRLDLKSAQFKTH